MMEEDGMFALSTTSKPVNMGIRCYSRILQMKLSLRWLI